MWSIEQDQEPEEASEQITIVPDIVDMSDNYENIKVTRIRLNTREGICRTFTFLAEISLGERESGDIPFSTVIFLKVMKC